MLCTWPICFPSKVLQIGDIPSESEPVQESMRVELMLLFNLVACFGHVPSTPTISFGVVQIPSLTSVCLWTMSMKIHEKPNFAGSDALSRAVQCWSAHVGWLVGHWAERQRHTSVQKSWNFEHNDEPEDWGLRLGTNLDLDPSFQTQSHVGHIRHWALQTVSWNWPNELWSSSSPWTWTWQGYVGDCGGIFTIFGPTHG